MVILVLLPTGCILVILKENIGEGARQRDEEGQSKLTELSSMPKVWRAERKAPSRK